MLRALLLDLGDTLVRANHVIEHVPKALAQLAALPTEQDLPLQLALVSDYTMPGPGAAPEELARLFEEYVELVRGFGLLQCFEPVDQHITLSTQAGVSKPDARIFQLALQRLKLPPELASAMLITEAGDHVAAARRLGMTAWQYGKDFDDWTSAPLLVARALHCDDATSLLEPLRDRVQALFDKRVQRIEHADNHPVTVIYAVLAENPEAEVVIRLNPAGDVDSLEPVTPTDSEAKYRRSLEDSGALGAAGEPLAPGQTHVLEPGPDGKPKLTRKRFSLW